MGLNHTPPPKLPGTPLDDMEGWLELVCPIVRDAPSEAWLDEFKVVHKSEIKVMDSQSQRGLMHLNNVMSTRRVQLRDPAMQGPV